jgi:hypothetical protein
MKVEVDGKINVTANNCHVKSNETHFDLGISWEYLDRMTWVHLNFSIGLHVEQWL